MTKEELLAISGLTEEQEKAVDRWFKMPLNAKKPNGIEGTIEEIKAFLDKNIKDFNHRQELKKKNGTLDEVTALVRELCKGTKKQKALYTYKDIINIINAATAEKKKKIEKIRDLERELAAKKAELGLK